MWLAVSLMLMWVIYAIVSVVEFVAYVMYLTGTMGFARWYFSTVGYWGAVVAYGLPWVFALVQLSTETVAVWPGSWSIFQFMTSFIIWMLALFIHIYYID